MYFDQNKKVSNHSRIYADIDYEINDEIQLQQGKLANSRNG